MAHLLELAAAGVLAGMLSTVVGLASLVSYPALLLFGLPPIAANVTNTVALVSTAVGAVAGSRPELAGRGRLLGRLCAVSALGGTAGALLLLHTSSRAFAQVVPWLIAGASILLLIGPRLRRAAAGPVGRSGRIAGYLAVLPIGVYGGYFGAAAGVLLLAVLTLMLAGEPLAGTNAVKNVTLGAANAAAAVIFAVTGPVHWTAAAALAVGSLAGGWTGPAVARRLPAGPLRLFIAAAGIGLAVKLAADAGMV